MTRIKTLIVVASVLLFASAGYSQTVAKKAERSADETGAQRGTPAYAEVLLRRTELEAEVESLLIEYTEEYPKTKQARYELSLLQQEGVRLLAVRPADAAKLTLALGKLIVRKVALQAELWSLQQQYGDNHPDVKRAKRKVEIFEKAIKEILG